MKCFLDWLEAEPEFQAIRADLNAVFGNRLFTALCEQRWLVREKRNSWRYPCAQGWLFCYRRVVAKPDDPNEPFRVACGQCPQMCAPESLGQHDVTLWTPEARNLAVWLMNQLELEGTPQTLVRASPGYHLGTRMVEGRRERFFLVLRPGSEEVPWFIERLADLDDPAWVLVPTWDRVRIHDQVRYWRHACVTIAALEDLLSFEPENKAIQIEAIEKARERPVLWSGQGVRPYASVFDAGGMRLLSRVEYDTLLERRREYDLLLDMTTTTQGGRYAVWTRKRGGPQLVELTPSEASVLAFLMQQAPHVVSMHQLRRTQDLQRPDKVLEHARAAVDLKLGRTRWRSFHTVARLGDQPKGYRFDPALGVQWAILQPIPQVDAEADTLARVERSREI